MKPVNNQIQATVTEEVPEWKLNLAYWYTEHKILIKRALIFLIFFADLAIAIIWGMIFVNYRAGLLSDEKYLAALPINLVNNNSSESMKPAELSLGPAIILSGASEKNNLIALARNDNPDWAVKQISYTFNVNGQDLDTLTSFIPPKSEKYLAYYNAPLGNNVNLKILNTSWLRVRDFTMLSYKDNIKISAAQFVPSQSSVVSGEVKFTINNNTPYSFWEVGLPVVLFDRNDEPVAINYLVVNKLRSQEERSVEIGWPELIYGQVDRVKVYPEVNFFDDNILMKTEGGVGDPAGWEPTEE